ncbi:hypothetical protein [Halomarina ordinaria]|uniref:DUF1211 domain-containing protein n=1 Tax=Halomarina ordinaria TaxID=3033939 RepID=A0ABD5U8H4_9EURY|nr:hypothetical protein [Halomarina sp. PSRA2]
MIGADNQTCDTDTNSDEFCLAEFIDDRSSLFGTMGVFVAVAAYLSRAQPGPITDAELMLKAGYTASLGLALLILFLIYWSMRNEFGTWTDLRRAHMQLHNWTLTVFTGFTGLLILSVTHLVTLNDPVVFLLLLTGTAVFSLIAFTSVVYGVGRRVPRSPLWRIPTMFVVCSVVLAVSAYVRNQYLAGIEITTIQDLTFADPVPIVLMLTMVIVATIQSLAAVSLIATILGIPIVAIDKIRGVSP